MSTLKTLTTEIVDLIRVAAQGQREAVLDIGKKVDAYVVEYSAKMEDVALRNKARSKAIKVLAEDIKKAAPTQSFDVHRAYQIWGVTQVYGADSKPWGYSVLKEIAPTIVFDGEWKLKHGLKEDKVTAKVKEASAADKTQPTVAATRQVIAAVLGDKRRASPAKAIKPQDKVEAGNQPAKALPAAKPEPNIQVRDVAKPEKTQKEDINAAVESDRAGAEALQMLRDAPDKVRAVKKFAADLDNTEIMAIVQSLSRFESSWGYLRSACKAEHGLRNAK